MKEELDYFFEDIPVEEIDTNKILLSLNRLRDGFIKYGETLQTYRDFYNVGATNITDAEKRFKLYKEYGKEEDLIDLIFYLQRELFDI